MRKKFFRGVGYVICVLLIIMCILLIIQTAMFGAGKHLGLFGVKVYIVENSDLPTAPKGSAVIVKKCAAEDLEAGKAVLYLRSENADNPALGYVENISDRDGVQYITVLYHNEPYEFPEAKLVGAANYSSTIWGGIIRFMRTPLGVMVMAVLPCAALILFDVIRASAAKRPEPEVVPKVKNVDEERHVEVKLSVDPEGKALYSKDRNMKTLPQNNGVLYNHTAKQKATNPETPPKNRPIIPLTDRKSAPKPEETSGKVSENTGRLFDIKLPADKPVSEKFDIAEDITPEDDHALQTAAAPSARPKKAAVNSNPPVSEKTNELPIIIRKTNDDAFFAQPSAVGRQIAPQPGKNAHAHSSDLNDSNSENAPRSSHAKPERTAGKRSSQILASKSLDDFFADDDEPHSSRNISDKTVDDILAGINSRK